MPLGGMMPVRLHPLRFGIHRLCHRLDALCPCSPCGVLAAAAIRLISRRLGAVTSLGATPEHQGRTVGGSLRRRASSQLATGSCTFRSAREHMSCCVIAGGPFRRHGGMRCQVRGVPTSRALARTNAQRRCTSQQRTGMCIYFVRCSCRAEWICQCGLASRAGLVCRCLTGVRRTCSVLCWREPAVEVG